MAAVDTVRIPKHLRIDEAWHGLIAFEAVRQAFPEVSPREVFRKARLGELLRNDRPCSPLEALHSGDRLTVVLHRPPKPLALAPLREGEGVETAAGPFWVVWEDSDLLVAGKPAGCASHPALGTKGDTLLERIRSHLGARREDSFQPALANRLDIQTSGIVLVGKNRAARQRLGRNLQKGNVQKFYVTVAGGAIQATRGEIRRPLVRRPDSRDLARFPQGHPRTVPVLQEAATRYRVLERLPQPLRATLLEIELLTGRTHQIRRHLAFLGHPVAGDRRYGNPELNADLASVGGLDRMFLHAHRATLPHPTTGQRVEFCAPLPEDLASCLRCLGGNWSGGNDGDGSA